MTVDEAIEFFSAPLKSAGNDHKIATKLRPLADVGLGYIRLDNPPARFQEEKLSELNWLHSCKGQAHDHSLFIFDEPTTGLHFHDIKKLLKAFDMLIEQEIQCSSLSTIRYYQVCRLGDRPWT